jgi:hypothetical protein
LHISQSGSQSGKAALPGAPFLASFARSGDFDLAGVGRTFLSDAFGPPTAPTNKAAPIFPRPLQQRWATEHGIQTLFLRNSQKSEIFHSF